MITYVNSTNAGKYSVLFSTATQALLEAGVLKAEVDAENKPITDDGGLTVAQDPITTIEQYFSYLPDLIAIGDYASDDSYAMLRSEGRRYTMLPLDEDVLVVDGNSRTITMPASFIQNGIGVQGDKYAEIVYFVVDRFFDITDLDTCDIYIQWTNANGESGVSTPWVVDIESEPNKMIIGWALSNDITKYAGTLRFALRFFQWDKKELSTLKYSWSTLTQSATIKSSLDFVFGNGQYMIEDETNDAITNRIVNSNTTLAGVAKAEKPEYLTDLKTYADLVNKNTTLYNGVEALAGNTEIYPLEVQARSTDGGQISYAWKYIDQNGQEQTAYLGAAEDTTGAYVTIEFRTVLSATTEQIAALRASKKLLYQKKRVGDADVYTQVELPLEDATVQSRTYYERVAVCVATKVGTYYSIATNRLSSKNKADSKSVLCVIPMPSVPVIAQDLEEDKTLGIELASLNGGTTSTVKLTVEVTNAEDNGTKTGELIYAWYKRRIDSETGLESTGDTVNYSLNEDGTADIVDDASADWIRITDAATKDLVVTHSAEAAEEPKLTEGHYKVIVYNYKNLKYTKVGSSECRVSYAAVKPIISYPVVNDDATKVDFSDNTAVSNQIYVGLSEEWTSKWNISDEITYQWYQTTDDLAVVANDVAISGETGKQFIPTTTGKFYCEVTNHKGLTEAKEVSQIFYVV